MQPTARAAPPLAESAPVPAALPSVPTAQEPTFAAPKTSALSPPVPMQATVPVASVSPLEPPTLMASPPPALVPPSEHEPTPTLELTTPLEPPSTQLTGWLALVVALEPSDVRGVASAAGTGSDGRARSRLLGARVGGDTSNGRVGVRVAARGPDRCGLAEARGGKRQCEESHGERRPQDDPIHGIDLLYPDTERREGRAARGELSALIVPMLMTAVNDFGRESLVRGTRD